MRCVKSSAREFTRTQYNDNVVHMLRMYLEDASNLLYVAVSAPPGSFPPGGRSTSYKEAL